MPQQPLAPTEQEWRDLYHAAGMFKDLAPWEWMLDSDLFGVRDPQTSELGYCCVMGNLGEHFALGLYLGDEGLRTLVRLGSGEFDPPDLGLLFVQHCLSASFEDREVLSKQDRDLIKSLGLKYLGRNAWPLFRNYTPGYAPWYITGPDARFLTVALHQACGVAERFRDDEAVLDPPVAGQILVRAVENGEWRDTWRTPDAAREEPPPLPVPDEVRLRRLKQATLQRAGTWETDYFYSPQGVQEQPHQRPFFPTVCMFVDKATGMVLPPTLSGPEEWRAAYQEQLPTLIESLGAIPREIAVRSAEVRDLLAPVTEALGIKLRVVRRLAAFEEARNSMLSFFGGM